VTRESPAFASPWFSTTTACAYLDYTGRHALRSLYRFLQRESIIPSHVGRRLRIAKADLDRALARARRA
jgi:hypothetical protein